MYGTQTEGTDANETVGGTMAEIFWVVGVLPQALVAVNVSAYSPPAVIETFVFGERLFGAMLKETFWAGIDDQA